MNDPIIYNERVTSRKTEFLFITMTLLFLLLSLWRVMAGSLNLLTGIFLFFFCFFLFYSINYRTLIISITSEFLKLSFGVFTWTIPISNIHQCHPDDDIPVLMKYGGAGIHFMLVRNRYRGSFNFLEHSRIVIRLKRKAGLVRDISFSTCHPNKLSEVIQAAITTNQTA